MVKIGLQIKVNLEFVDKLYTSHPDFAWFLKIKCSNCGEISDRWHDITESEKIECKHQKSDTNFSIKCKLCSRENNMDIISGSNSEYLENDANKFKTIVKFECRGIEPVEFSPRSGWLVESADNGTKFHDVDLTEKEWVEYDEKNGTSVGIYDFESQFIKIK